MSKYYSDDEIIERIINVGNGKDSYEWLADLVRQRFILKDNQLSWLRERVNVAANIIGHQTITEAQEYE